MKNWEFYNYWTYAFVTLIAYGFLVFWVIRGCFWLAEIVGVFNFCLFSSFLYCFRGIFIVARVWNKYSLEKSDALKEDQGA